MQPREEAEGGGVKQQRGASSTPEEENPAEQEAPTTHRDVVEDPALHRPDERRAHPPVSQHRAHGPQVPELRPRREHLRKS